MHDISFIISIRNIVLVIRFCILKRGNKIWYLRIQWNSGRATWYDITSGRVFGRNQINKFVDLLWHREANLHLFTRGRRRTTWSDGYMVYLIMTLIIDASDYQWGVRLSTGKKFASSQPIPQHRLSFSLSQLPFCQFLHWIKSINFLKFVWRCNL